MITTEDFQHEAVRLRSMLKTVALRYLGDGDEVEDVVQDVLLKMWLMREQLCLPVESLARVLVRNAAIDRLRRRKPAVTADSLQLPDEEDKATEGVERMMRLVETLPSMQQTVIRLRHLEGMEMADVARLVGTTEVAVRKSLSRARKTLRDEYMKQLER